MPKTVNHPQNPTAEMLTWLWKEADRDGSEWSAKKYFACLNVASDDAIRRHLALARSSLRARRQEKST